MNSSSASTTNDKPNERVRIGMICPFWLPRHGGGEQYDHRLALELGRQGFDVRVFSGTAVIEGKDNGEHDVTRQITQGDLLHSSWKEVYRYPKVGALARLMNHYTFMNEAVQWCKEHHIQIALISNPFQQTELAHVRELYLQLRCLGIKTGVIHFDLAPHIDKALVQTYHRTQSWETTKTILQNGLHKILRESAHLQGLHAIGSPLFFEPDFVLSCSDWSCSFIDPLESIPKIVLHPILDCEHWSASPVDQESFVYRDVLMINPFDRKGPKLMADLIKDETHELTFRVLKGGWGDSFKTFIPEISDSLAHRTQRVDWVEYVQDIRHAYRAAGLIFFPSLYEGYGMTAVEPMYSGTPVVSSSHPAIMEAVGSGALTLCPYLDGPDRWASAVSEVLRDREVWSRRALDRAKDLDVRQKNEIAHLREFLLEQAQ